MAIKLLKAWGCEITAFTSNLDKSDELKGMGADHVVNSRDSAALKAQRQVRFIAEYGQCHLELAGLSGHFSTERYCAYAGSAFRTDADSGGHADWWRQVSYWFTNRFAGGTASVTPICRT